MNDLQIAAQAILDWSGGSIERDAMIAALLKQALEALEAMQMEAATRACGLKITDDAIAALKAALAQPVEPALTMSMFANRADYEAAIAQPVEPGDPITQAGGLGS